jgi:RHS repeat-associated protein
VQHIEYVPFGEVFIEERNSTWKTPYKFNAKELDEETGLYCYGARCLAPREGVWLSVDPLAEKYPELSPYVYCHNNPINMVDPEGLTDYNVTSDGHVNKAHPTWDAVKKFFGGKDKDDKLIAVDNKNKTLVMPAGSIGEINKLENDKGEYFNVSNDKVAGTVHEFLSENTGAEFSRTEYNNSKETGNVISTSYKANEESVGSLIANKLLSDGLNVTRLTHSHPGGGPPSGYVPGQMDSGDRDLVNYMNKYHPENSINYRVYDVPKRRYIYYNNINIYKYEKKSKR